MMRSKSPQRGLAVVEFALVLPVVLVILFGIFEFGFAFWRKQSLTAAVREGGRVAILATAQRTTRDAILAKVASYMTSVGLPPVSDYGPGCTNCPCTVSGQPVTVFATYPANFRVLSRLEFAGVQAVNEIRATVVMQCE